MTTPQPGQIYRSADPREAGQRIRVLSVTGDHATIESVTGPARRRSLLTSALHSTATTATGAPRRTGYVLAGAQATPVRDDTRPAAPDHLGLHTTPDGSLWAPLSDRPPHPPMLQRIRDEHGHACGRISAEPQFVEEHFGPLTPIAVVPAAALAWGYGTVTRTRDHVEIQLAAPAPPLRLTTDQAQVLGDQLLDTADGERGIPDDAPAPAAGLGLDLDAIRANLAATRPRIGDSLRAAQDATRVALTDHMPALLTAVEQQAAEITRLHSALTDSEEEVERQLFEAQEGDRWRAQVIDLGALVREAADVLGEFVRDRTDPGTAALGLLHRLRHANTAPATTTETTGARAARSLTAIDLDAWNAIHPVGTPVLAWPGTRDEKPLVTRTRSAPWLLGHGQPVVSVEGRSGGIALTHVQRRPDAPCDRCPGTATTTVRCAYGCEHHQCQPCANQTTADATTTETDQ